MAPLLAPNDVVTTSASVVPEPNADTEFVYCDRYVSIGSNHLKLYRQIDSLRYHSLDTLKNMAIRSGASYAHCVLGLQITLGLSSPQRMKLLYKPVVMSKVKDSTDAINSATLWGIYHLEPNTFSYYTYNRATRSFNTTTDLSCISSYTNSVMIKHDKAHLDAFISTGPDAQKDVTSMIFTFQEIDSLVSQNPNNMYIRVLNAAIDCSNTTTPYIKHTLLLGPSCLDPQLINMKFFGQDFDHKYANLSHLCPPSCSTHIYQLK